MPIPTRLDFFVKGEALDTELLQCLEEGKNVKSVQAEAAVLKKLDYEKPATQQIYRSFLEKTFRLEVVNELRDKEPDDLDKIRALRPRPTIEVKERADKDRILEKAHGAWLGRCCGCLLGKPVEHWKSCEIHDLLQAQGKWPLAEYMSGPAPEEYAKKYPNRSITIDVSRIDGMPEDDDLNYTVTGYGVYKEFGSNFTSEDVAHFWLCDIPILRTYTAERVAYKNVIRGLLPPESGRTANIYREWIGAQIRADFWGCVCPGRPEMAAEYAWRDARVSHVKNGIYGEMWVAAMLAAACEIANPRDVVTAGLEQIPAECRLAKEIREILDRHKEGVAADETAAWIHQRWDEKNAHHWCHTISNAALVTLALLWGGLDFGRSICLAVQPGFDTDCNGATVGSIVGMMLGSDGIPARWSTPIHDTLHTGVRRYPLVHVSEMAEQTVRLAFA